MRKDSVDSKRLGGVYSVYQLQGLNLDRFINLVAVKGINLYKVKKITNKQITFCVNVKQNKKFFAIINKIWYNNKNIYLSDGKNIALNGGYLLTRLKTVGWLSPLYALSKRWGLICGGLAFIILTAVFSDVVLAIDYYGSGYSQQGAVQEYLLGRGVQTSARFSQIDLNSLSDEILANNPSLSFVSCYKRGNRLKICLEKSVTPPSILVDNTPQLFSTVDGVVGQIKVYRGSAVVNVGDAVKVGDLLVDGYVTFGEQKLQVNVLASVVIVSNYTTEYTFNDQFADNLALIYAQQELADKEILNSTLAKTPCDDGRTKYTVTLTYQTLIVTG